MDCLFVGCIYCDVTSLDLELNSLTSLATKKLSLDLLSVDVDPLISPHFKLFVGVFRCLFYLGGANKPFDWGKFP